MACCAVVCCALQAIDWLKATINASGASCEVVAQHDTHFLNSLELAVRFGSVRDTLSGNCRRLEAWRVLSLSLNRSVLCRRRHAK